MVMMGTVITATAQPGIRSTLLIFPGWVNFAVVAAGGRTNYYINGKFVGDADRREQSVMKFIGNSSSGELFAEYLDDIRIYGISLSFSEVAAIYGGGFGDQYPFDFTY